MAAKKNNGSRVLNDNRYQLGQLMKLTTLKTVPLDMYIQERNRLLKNSLIHEAQGNYNTYWTNRLHYLDHLNPKFKGIRMFIELIGVDERGQPKIRFSRELQGKTHE